MDVIKEIIQKSAIGPYSNWSKGFVLSVFSSIVFTLMTMLVVLLHNAENLKTYYGY